MRTTEERQAIFEQMVGEAISDEFKCWLYRQTDFFTAPASTKYHGNYPGGLFDHSLGTAKSLRWLTDNLGLTWKRPKSPEIVGFAHDACKFNLYFQTSCMGGQYFYEHSKEEDFPGHGEKSLLVLMPHISLTDEEIMCIRYHMGAFVDSKEWNYYSRACKKFPNVLFAHTADMLASQVEGV